LREPGVPERFVHLGRVPDVVTEDALDHGAARVDPGRVPFGPTDLLVQHLEGPSVEAALDDPEGRVEGVGETVGAPDMVEVVVARAVERRVRERRGLHARLASRLRILLPPNARPELQSSRLAQTIAPPRCSVSRSSGWTGLGPNVNG
jgi:hypothetical protein